VAEVDQRLLGNDCNNLVPCAISVTTFLIQNKFYDLDFRLWDASATGLCDVIEKFGILHTPSEFRLSMISQSLASYSSGGKMKVIDYSKYVL
jgi:hypothetical protein